MRSKANNFKIFRSAEKSLLKPPSLTVGMMASVVDTSFKYSMVILDSVPAVDTLCCLLSVKVPSFIIPSTSAGDGDFHNYISLIKRRGSMFLVCDSTFV